MPQSLCEVVQKWISWTASQRAHSLFYPRKESQTKWISLGTELCWLGGGDDTDKVKFLLPVSKWFSSFLCLSGVLQLLNWSLNFSEKYFASNIIASSVFVLRTMAGTFYYAILLVSLSISFSILKIDANKRHIFERTVISTNTWIKQIRITT